MTDPNLPWSSAIRPRGGSWLTALCLATTLACSTNDGGGGAGGSSGSGGSAAAAGGKGGGAGTLGGGGMGASASSGAGSGGNGNAAGKSNVTTAGTSGAAGASVTSGAGGGGGASAESGAGGTGGAATGGAAPGGAGAGGAPNVTDKVTKSASTYMFKHFPIQVNADGVWNGPTTPGTTPMTTAYDTWVLENGYLKVTILPSYGGRILSIVHKPTNRELLYQNPIGTPYLMQEGIFYYDYLVIMGGIFPSFPEPEHGKYWNQPYDFEVVSETPEAITVRMSRKDDKDLAAGVPEKYDVGRTDVLVELEVTLRAGSSALDLSTKLTNTRNAAVPSFEYWTVTTLAPGSMPGQTAIPLETRILAQMDQVHCLESSWAWFGDAEERVNGEVFKWKNLVQFKNWADQGTCFANPKYSANWSGLANDTTHMNYVRVSKNEVTPGLKLWTFGKQSLSSDINDPATWLRPTIEMWHGVTPEFWSRGTLAANEVRTWSDRYFATLGLTDITAASENGAASLSSSASGSDTVLSAAATLTVPDQTVKAVLKLGGTVVAEKDVVVAADAATMVTATVPTTQAAAGAVFQADFMQGDKTLLSAQTTLK